MQIVKKLVLVLVASGFVVGGLGGCKKEEDKPATPAAPAAPAPK